MYRKGNVEETKAHKWKINKSEIGATQEQQKIHF